MLIGLAAAAKNLPVDVIGALFTILAGLTIHIIANLFNSYYDWQFGYDSPDDSQVVPLLTDHNYGSQSLYRLARFFLFIGTLLTIGLGILYGGYVFTISVVGLLGAYYYTSPPIAYKYRGWSLPAVFVFMGLLMPLNTFLVQTGHFQWILILYALPPALLITAMLQANELRDYQSDSSHNIKSFTAIAGFKFGTILYRLLLYIPYLVIVVSTVFNVLPLTVMILVFLSLPYTQKLNRMLNNQQLRTLDIGTAKLHSIFSFLYLIGFVIASI